MRTKGISPKVLADLVISLLTFALTAGVIELDPVLAAGISKFLGTVAAVIAGPGEVEYDGVAGGDGGQAGLTTVELLLVLILIVGVIALLFGLHLAD